MDPSVLFPVVQEPQAAPSVRGLPRKRGADDELSEDHKSLAKMIKIEKDLGSEVRHKHCTIMKSNRRNVTCWWVFAAELSFGWEHVVGKHSVRS